MLIFEVVILWACIEIGFCSEKVDLQTSSYLHMKHTMGELGRILLSQFKPNTKCTNY